MKATAMGLGRADILIVDDDPGVRSFLADLLIDEGHQIVAVDSGESALEQITTQEFDLALLDLRMEGIGGLEVLAALRQQAPDTIAIILTGHSSLGTAIEALRQGAYDYLLKPCKPDDLRNSVNGGLDSRRDLLRQRVESRFVSDVSHELRNPITSMDLNLHLAEYGTPERRSYHLNAVRQATRQLEHLVEDALELSGLEANAAQERFAPEDLNLLVKNTVDAYRPYAVAAGLELFFEPGVNLPPVRAAYHRLVQVVTNLVVNAINYTPTGQVWVSTYLDTERERACLQVRDTGIGIDPGDLPHVFERFYRGLRATASDIPGTGLGLAIAKEIVDWHRGEIEVESRVDVGSTFRVWLPLDSHNGKRVTGKLR